MRTLREREPDGSRRARTPAMAAGLSDHVWSIKEWITYPAKPCQPSSDTTGYRRTPASYGAIQSLLSRIDPEALETALARWVAHLLGASDAAKLRAVALDGKAARGSLTALKPAVHLLAAMDQRTGCVPRQTRVDVKTNEHKAALELLKGLTLRGRVVTGDAMFRQRDLSRQIVDAGGHYLWKVDDNQPSLKEAIASAFEPAHSPPRTTSPGRRG